MMKKKLQNIQCWLTWARNDLGKVCKFGSVVTDELMTVKQFSHIQHIVSHVIGILDKKNSIFDAFKSVFPAGTVTGYSES